ncbi:hypothetical protein [Blastopirellula marina]|uniref:Outer membrane protein beta-barrel domain-containing protein n=1 Tax=Blastopirellula marina TaxID=124 RepID=A0A2S8GNV1_9BACT|nr:hypothetical protein [Blastopirellula marina]PQO46092.1 hypothetical protein C5Y93_10985 [Blastopirellula marina]
MKMTGAIYSLVGLLFCSTFAMGQDLSMNDLRSISEARYFENRISELEQRLEQYEQLTSTAAPSIATDGEEPVLPPVSYSEVLQPLPCHSCETSCPAADRWMNPNGGAYGSVEILLLRWYDTDGDDGSNTTSDASRITLGYMTKRGRSLRFRYFEFAVGDDLGAGQSLFEQADLEYAGRFSLGQNWQGELSLGARWASHRNPTPRVYGDTYGPVMGVNLRSELRDWLSLYGTARQSFQFGREENEDDLKTFGITELGLGVEFSLETCRREWYARTGVESLYYTSVRDDEEDYGLVGWTFEIGTRF